MAPLAILSGVVDTNYYGNQLVYVAFCRLPECCKNWLNYLSFELIFGRIYLSRKPRKFRESECVV